MINAILLKLFAGVAKKPLIITLLIGALLVAVTAGYFHVKAQGYQAGYISAAHQCLQEKEQAIIRAVKQTNRKNQVNAEIAKAYWQKKLTKKPKIQIIEKRIVEYVEVNNNDKCMLNDDELFILTDLVSIANGTDTTETTD